MKKRPENSWRQASFRAANVPVESRTGAVNGSLPVDIPAGFAFGCYFGNEVSMLPTVLTSTRHVSSRQRHFASSPSSSNDRPANVVRKNRRNVAPYHQ
jgi:hypothetical protein